MPPIVRPRHARQLEFSPIRSSSCRHLYRGRVQKQNILIFPAPIDLMPSTYALKEGQLYSLAIGRYRVSRKPGLIGQGNKLQVRVPGIEALPWTLNCKAGNCSIYALARLASPQLPTAEAYLHHPCGWL
jgi:hypothetical protein